MLPRFLIPTIGVLFLAGSLMGCAPSSEQHPQVQTGSEPPLNEIIEWHSDELMATGGDLVLNQVNSPYRA
jgi:hypothetical protein